MLGRKFKPVKYCTGTISGKQLKEQCEEWFNTLEGQMASLEKKIGTNQLEIWGARKEMKR